MQRQLLGSQKPSRKSNEFAMSVSNSKSSAADVRQPTFLVDQTSPVATYQSSNNIQWQELTPPPSSNVSLIIQEIPHHVYQERIVSSESSPQPFSDADEPKAATDVRSTFLRDFMMQNCQIGNSQAYTDYDVVSESSSNSVADKESVLSTSSVPSMSAMSTPSVYGNDNFIQESICEASDVMYPLEGINHNSIYDVDGAGDVDIDDCTSSSAPLSPSVPTVEAPCSSAPSICGSGVEVLSQPEEDHEFGRAPTIEHSAQTYRSVHNFEGKILGTQCTSSDNSHICFPWLSQLENKTKNSTTARLLFHGPPSPLSTSQDTTYDQYRYNPQNPVTNAKRMVQVLQHGFALEQGVAELEREIQKLSSQIDALRRRNVGGMDCNKRNTKNADLTSGERIPQQAQSNRIATAPQPRLLVHSLLRQRLQRVLGGALDFTRTLDEAASVSSSHSRLDAVTVATLDDLMQSHIGDIGLCIKLFDKLFL